MLLALLLGLALPPCANYSAPRVHCSPGSRPSSSVSVRPAARSISSRPITVVSATVSATWVGMRDAVTLTGSRLREGEASVGWAVRYWATREVGGVHRPELLASIKQELDREGIKLAAT